MAVKINSIKESMKKYFFPLKNNLLNLSFYISIAALSVPLAICEYKNYSRDVAKYENREILREPTLSDYGPIGRLEKWISNDEEQT